MKSYIKKMVDYKDASIQTEVDLSGMEDYINKNIHHVVRKHKQLIEADVIQKGDIVTLDLESDNPKFNRKNIVLAIGSNMFDDELEEALVSLPIQSEKAVKINDEHIKVKVLSIKRYLYPEINDEILKEYVEDKEELAGIDSVDSYKAYLVKKYRDECYERQVGKNMNIILNYIVENNEWEIDQDELAEMSNSYIDELKQELASENKSMETLSEEELQLEFGVNTLEELKDYINQSSIWAIESALFQVALLDKDSKELNYEQAVELGWDVLFDYVRSQMVMNEKGGE